MIKEREAVRQDGLPYFVCRDTAARRAARPAIQLKAERGTNMFDGTTFANEKTAEPRFYVFSKRPCRPLKAHIPRGCRARPQGR